MVGHDSQNTHQQKTQHLVQKSHVRHHQKSEFLKLTNIELARISRNFILRDFMYSTHAKLMGVPNEPEDLDMVIKSGKAICEKILEPILEHFGRFAITFGYGCRQVVEADMSEAQRAANPRSSSPHQWDRSTWGNEIYARVDILPFCVEDGLVSKYDFGHWLMHNLDADLLMQWSRSNIFCITISPKPRRVWLEWNSNAKGRTTFMGAEYWQKTYPTLAEHERPKFGPSCTGGAMQWRVAK
jgi:hypothetical protein